MLLVVVGLGLALSVINKHNIINELNVIVGRGFLHVARTDEYVTWR
jgi:hypothetical protein